MQIISKSTLKHNYKDSDFKLIQDYLSEIYKRSFGAYRNQKSAILNCLNYLNKDLELISMIDIKNYFKQSIEKKNIGFDSKNTYRSYLTSFFDYIVRRFLELNKEYRNPVPNVHIFEFTKKSTDIKKQSEKKLKIFSHQELQQILEKSRKKSLRDFILYALLIVTGARISEILSIKMKDINFKERYFETGFEKDARKTTRKTKESLLFFFPEQFRSYLEQYILYLGKGAFWLFPGKNNYYSYTAFRNYVTRNYGSRFCKFHTFRSTLISNRLMKMNCPLWISEGLTNHKINNSTQIKHYAKFTVKEKRDLYDRYFPYYHFPYF